ncbi:MAG: hypothetical protein WCF07_06330 [Nitrososphaeraceae archaeon]
MLQLENTPHTQGSIKILDIAEGNSDFNLELDWKRLSMRDNSGMYDSYFIFIPIMGLKVSTAITRTERQEGDLRS